MHWCKTRCETGDQAFFTHQPQSHLSFGQESASLHCLILELPATRHTTKLSIPWRRFLTTPKPWISKPSLEQFLTLALGFLHGFAVGLVARRKTYHSLSLKFAVGAFLYKTTIQMQWKNAGGETLIWARCSFRVANCSFKTSMWPVQQDTFQDCTDIIGTCRTHRCL